MDRKLKIVSGGATKSYIGNFEYNNSTVEAIYHPEGRARNNAGTYIYEYVIKDLPTVFGMGNARVSFTNSGGTIALVQVEAKRRSRIVSIGKNHYALSRIE